MNQIADITRRFSRQVQRQFQRAQQEEAAYQRRLAAQERSSARREAAEAERVRVGIAKRLPLAERGLATLIELGKSVQIQKLLTAISDVGLPHVTFYVAARVSGFYWEASKEAIAQMEENGGELVSTYDEDSNSTSSTRRSPYNEEHLFVDVMHTHLLLSSGSMNHSRGIQYSVYYEPQECVETQYQVSVAGTDVPGGKEQLLNLGEFLGEIARPHTVNMARINHPAQHSHEWEAEEVFFQLLVSCGRKRAFDRYLSQALAALEQERRKRRRRTW